MDEKYLKIIKEPWSDLENTGNALLIEAKKEIHKNHILFNKIIIPIARRCDRDDVLFYVKEDDIYAIVHLTWIGKEEKDKWSNTKIYNTLNELKDKIDCDNIEFGD
jgi:hypothetical protein